MNAIQRAGDGTKKQAPHLSFFGIAVLSERTPGGKAKTIVMIREPSIFAELMIVLWDLVGTTMGPDTGVSSVR